MPYPNRRDFLRKTLLTAALVTGLKTRAAVVPAYYPVQWDDWTGKRCTLYWDGKQDWKAECGDERGCYTHPHAWHGLDAEFFRMQEAAENMANRVRERVYLARRNLPCS